MGLRPQHAVAARPAVLTASSSSGTSIGPQPPAPRQTYDLRLIGQRGPSTCTQCHQGRDGTGDGTGRDGTTGSSAAQRPIRTRAQSFKVCIHVACPATHTHPISTHTATDLHCGGNQPRHVSPLSSKATVPPPSAQFPSHPTLLRLSPPPLSGEGHSLAPTPFLFGPLNPLAHPNPGPGPGPRPPIRWKGQVEREPAGRPAPPTRLVSRPVSEVRHR